MKKSILLAISLIIICLSGCASVDKRIVKAHKLEAKHIQLIEKNYRLLSEKYIDDMVKTFNHYIEKMTDYELKILQLETGATAPDKVKEIMDRERKLKAAVQTRVKEMRKEVDKSRWNFEIVKRIHFKIAEYLEALTNRKQSVTSVIDDLMNIEFYEEE